MDTSTRIMLNSAQHRINVSVGAFRKAVRAVRSITPREVCVSMSDIGVQLTPFKHGEPLRDLAPSLIAAENLPLQPGVLEFRVSAAALDKAVTEAAGRSSRFRDMSTVQIAVVIFNDKLIRLVLVGDLAVSTIPVLAEHTLATS